MMVTETVAFHGQSSLSRELSGLDGYRRSLDITPLGVVHEHRRRHMEACHSGTQRRSRHVACLFINSARRFALALRSPRFTSLDAGLRCHPLSVYKPIGRAEDCPSISSPSPS